MDYTDQIDKALERVFQEIARRDSKLLSDALPDIERLIGEDRDKLKAFFASNPQEVRLWFERRIPPKSFAARRYVALVEGLGEMLDVILSGERALLDDYLTKAVKLSEAEKSALFASSLFMSPVVKGQVLQQSLALRSQGLTLSQRLWGANTAAQDLILSTINTNLAAGKNPKEIIRIIKAEVPRQQDYVVKRLVVTESRRMWQATQKQAVSEFKHIKYVVFRLDRRHKVKDICDQWVAKGRVLYSEAPNMPLHPNSRTILQPVPTPVEEWKRDRGL